jgi:hypothetical protein
MTTPSTPTPTPSTTEQTTPVASISQQHRLKKLWNRLSEDGRAYWKDLFGSLGEHWLELERDNVTSTEHQHCSPRCSESGLQTVSIGG